ncbi:hypothetical protein [Tenacibaculum piscium]|uniref:Isoleucyl-tRNA synthetase n=1 Tax=Tenacibaculum piscium TaxID=1458515 RepID=A0A2H1YJX6_9FLAO|nr:hypothetical protein [Tenacibaculum piscium]MBE7629421.1 hypothetical protein [Tenacibaculum piscium]MBE7671292.1 hypothetical protein [Tenacibaculum piscium]MBE7686215.1 hypothetical protein [Tenacibaculum piscium]SOS75783.1 conserved hypothetical protein [Tenacibaculum piscium]
MKTILKILFIIFLLWMLTGAYFLNTEHLKAPIIMGLGVLYMAFILMPLFIFYRYKDGKYKKYVINTGQQVKTTEKTTQKTTGKISEK